MAERTASAVWRGTLMEGRGEVTLETTKVLVSSPVTWQARVDQPDGRTSPEELLAGAHAACYCMAFSNTLTQQGYPPDTIEVRATCTFSPKNGGYEVSKMALHARAAVKGIDEEAFQQAARAAEAGCPISNAIRGGVAIELEATLTAPSGMS
jgi:lipoyl-dependent peroxiredoxin